MSVVFGLVGAGGFGREVMPLVPHSLQRAGLAPDAVQVFFVDDRLAGQTVNGRPTVSVGEFEALPGRRLFNIAVADAPARRKLAERLSRGAEPLALVASNAFVGDANVIGPGAILCPFTTVTSNARIGAFFHCNLYAYVAHDCVVGDYVTFAPAVRCNGAVVVEDEAYLGTGAVLRQGTADRPLTIGRGAVVGMGAVVTRSVEAGTTVAGNPARKLHG